MFEFLKKNTDPKSMLKKALGDYTLPSFPAVILKTLETIRDPNSTSSDVAENLSSDPALTVKVLKTVNSAAFSPVKKIENLGQAIALMGMSALESLVLSIEVTKVLPNASATGFDPKVFWHVSARRAYLAKALSGLLHPPKNMESFTAGLLQDMAVPFLATKKTTEYGPILERWHDGEENLNELEHPVFGWDHAEVATWMCLEWGLPDNLVAAIGGHHQNNDQCKFDRPAAVYLVSFLKDSEEHSGTERLVQIAGAKFGLDEEKINRLVEESSEKAEELINIIS